MIFVEQHGDDFELQSRGPSSCVASPSLTVVADATFDNVDALRARGLTLGAAPSAAEIVAAAYRRWGAQCAARLLGDFAFVVWDRDQRTLVCARDHLGIRPLYWRRNQAGVVVGSVARDVAGDGAQPSHMGIALYLLGHHDEVNHTLFEDVAALPPAHQLTVEGGRSQLDAYWRAEDVATDRVVDDAALDRRFAHTFREAVRCRSAVAGPLGVEISGGLDSSAVAAMARELHLHASPLGLHLSFSHADCDETRYALAVANRLGVPLVQQDASKVLLGHGRDDHPDLIFDPTLACYDALLGRAAERGTTTVLTGLGGDQLLDEAPSECASALRAGGIGDALRIAGVWRRPFAPGAYRNLWRRGVRPLVPEPMRRWARRFRARPDMRPLTADVGRRATDLLYTRSASRRAGIAGELEAHTLLFPVQQSHRLGASHGVSYRHPFLDVRLVELMLATPRRARLRQGIYKHKPLLRRAVRDKLPSEVLDRTDAGEFSGYLRYVLVERYGQETRSLFGDSRLADLGIVDPNAMRETLNGFSQRQINSLTLATGMELWLRRTWP